MVVIINGRVFDSTKDFITIVMEGDKERNLIAENLKNMSPRLGERFYMAYPSGVSEERVQREFEEVKFLGTVYLKNN